MTAKTDRDRDRWRALGTLCVGMLMIVLDVTVVNVALPSIQRDLGVSDANLAWVINSYLIAFAGLLLLAGRLGDLLGRQRVLQVGLGTFTVASLACGAAQTEGQLVAARFVQGVGGALASAVILGMIVTMFPEPGEQARALGVYGFVASAGGAVGLLAGGVLTALVSWHWIFLVNVPIGVATMVAVSRLVPADIGLGVRAGADVPGAVLITGALMIAVSTVVRLTGDHALSAGSAAALGGLSLLLLVLFVLRQTRAATPLMPLRLLRSRLTVAANVVQGLTVAGMFGMFFLLTLYVQRTLGWDALKIGLAFLPMTLVMAVVSLRVSDRLAARFGAHRTLVAGTALAAVGLALTSRLPTDASYVVDIAPGLLLLGLGMGVAFPALMGLSMAESTDEDAGLASGIVNTSAEAGAALGLAVLATLAESRTRHQRAAGLSDTAALVSGFHLAFWVASGLLAVAAVVAAVGMRPALDGASPAPAPEQAPVGV